MGVIWLSWSPQLPTTEVRGENTPERNFASTWSGTHNHQVMTPTSSPPSHPDGANKHLRTICEKGANAFTKSTGPCQLARIAQADTGRNLSLHFNIFCMANSHSIPCFC